MAFIEGVALLKRGSTVLYSTLGITVNSLINRYSSRSSVIEGVSSIEGVCYCSKCIWDGKSVSGIARDIESDLLRTSLTLSLSRAQYCAQGSVLSQKITKNHTPC